MKVKMKQNKNSSVIRIFSATLALFVLFFSLCVPSFAEESTPTFEDSILPYVNTTTIDSTTFGNGLLLFTNSNSSGSSGSSWVRSDKTVYSFAIADGNTTPWIIFVSEDSFTDVVFGQKRGTSYSGDTGISSTINTDYNLYVGQRSVYQYYWNTISYNIPVYTSLNDGLDAFQDYLESSGGTIVGEFTTSIQPGYALFVDITNLNVSVQLSQTTPISYWGLGSTQFYGTVNAIPNPITESSLSSIIPWTGSGRADMYGKYSNWVSSFSLSGSASGHNHVYLGIINPLNNNSTAGSGYDVSSVANGIITIHASNSNSVKLYPLSTSFNAGVFNSESGDVVASGTPDGSGGVTWTDDATGETYVPTFGGLTNPSNTANTINDWLENIASTIGGFFKGAIGAVTTLVSAGSDFIHSLSGLYAWLPGPVYSVLTSALVLIITIGVIKVFI